MANSQQNAVRRPALRLEHILLMAFLAFALLAGAGLFFLKKTHDRQTRLAATENVLRRGASLLDTLSTLGAAATPEEASRGLSEAAVSIFAVRPDVQSLSVTHGTVTVLQRQAHGFDSHARPPYTMPEDIGTDVTVAPGTLEIGGVQQQVFLLTKTVLLDDGTPVVIEATLKRDAVGQEEQTARAAVSSLSAFSVAVLILSFSACAVVLTLAVVRDRRREQRARQEEHLAFSGVLANGILHDFRNPMSAVRLDAQMLEREMARADGFRPERVTELADRIAHAMGRMDKVFQEFLFLAKPTDERPERVNLEQAVQACCETLAPRVEHSGVSVRIDAQETPPVAAFPFALRRALLNVLVNALQFAPKGSEVEVALFAAHGRAVIEVRDRGPGIPAGQRARIFEMFVTTRPEGTGLGLFLARTAIRRCGGDIEALARPGGGTIIRISLPESDQWPVTSDQKAANHPSLTTKH